MDIQSSEEVLTQEEREALALAELAALTYTVDGVTVSWDQLKVRQAEKEAVRIKPGALHRSEVRPNVTLDNRIQGALLGLACGDALGAPAEFKSQADVKARWGTLTEMVGGGPWKPGEWTDDTAMTLCIAEGILANPQDPVPETGTRFLAWSRNAKDVGSTIRAALSAFKGDWPTAAKGTPQARSGMAGGNGSLMRTLPVALAYGPEETQMLRQAARLSAMTHWDSQAEAACIVYCLWVENVLEGHTLRSGWDYALTAGKVYACRTGETSEFPGSEVAGNTQFWSRLRGVNGLTRDQLQPSGYAGYVVECLEAAAWCCLNSQSYEEAIVTAVNLAGEADTIAAVAGGIAGTFWGREAIPQRWLDALHQRSRVENTASQLADLRSHLAVYANPKLPAFEFSPVAERILAGRNPLTAHDVATLAGLGITHVLDMREPQEWELPKAGAQAVATIQSQGMKRLNLPVTDTRPVCTATLNEACQFLSNALADESHRVYVHCRAGLERTAAVLVAYYANSHNLSYDAALAQLKLGRPKLAPLPGQELAVRDWLSDLAPG